MSTILSDCLRRPELAKELGKSERTIHRWTTLPDGLPFIPKGKEPIFHIPTVREWLMGRMRQRNVRGTRAKAAS